VCYTAFNGCKAANRLISWPRETVRRPRANPLRVDLAESPSRRTDVQRHLRLAIYDLTSGSFPELADLTEKGILPIFSEQPGFIEYGVADLGNRKVCSITIWETREQAEKSAAVAATWVKENISDRVRLVTNYVGDLAFLHGTPVLA
jgi:hypothetical protein